VWPTVCDDAPMNEADVVSKLAGLGYVLPTPTPPLAAYVPCVRTGDLLFVSGQVPMVDGEVVSPGHLGDQVTVEQGQEAARRAAVQALAVIRGEIGTLDRLARIVQLTVFVASTPEFGGQPQVANGASELLQEVLGDPGRHARAAIGMAALPLGASVEVAVIAQVS
jgi:enamine deaminase RidA (YjgF/YER057c/UK114 family)